MAKLQGTGQRKLTKFFGGQPEKVVRRGAFRHSKDPTHKTIDPAKDWNRKWKWRMLIITLFGGLCTAGITSQTPQKWRENGPRGREYLATILVATVCATAGLSWITYEYWKADSR